MKLKRIAMLLSLLALVAAFGVGQAAAMDKAPLGKVIHKSKVSGYELVYRLIDVKEKMESMKAMNSGGKVDPAKLKSHHLMVMATGSDGQEVTKAMVGYLVVGPDGTQQKAMAMFMNGGFGADIDLKAKGDYQVKTKLVIGQTKLMDGFKLRMD